MRPSHAPRLFNGAASDVLDIAEALPAYALGKDILGLDKAIADLERAAQTMRDCYNCLRLEQDFEGSQRAPVIVL